MTAKKKQELKQDPRNYRIHSERNRELINKSLADLGAGRSILVDSEGYAIAGNGVLAQAEALGIPVQVIETDGTKLIAVKRTDLAPDDPRRKLLALADNATSDSSDWDTTALLEDWDPEDLGGWDVDTGEDVDYSGKNKEIDVDDFEDKSTITLSYTLDEYEVVKSELFKIAGTPEDAVWKLLGLDNE